MAVIGVDKGHTLQNGGCCGACGLLKESVENRPVGDLVIQGLRLKGHTVIDCSCDYATNSSNQLYNIVKKANAQPLDLFISLHLNAFNGSGYGAEIITTTTTSQENKEHADKVINHYCDKLGFKNRGHKYNNNLYVLRKTNAKAMLIEMCFVDNQGDANRWNQLGHQAIANAIIEGVLYEVGESEIVEEPKKEENKPQVDNTPKLGSYEYARNYANKNLNIKDIQKRLDYIGYSMNPYGVDGSYGQHTFEKVKEFQADNKLDVDGNVGNITLAKLNEKYNAKVQANKPKKVSIGNPNCYVEWCERLQKELNRQGYRDYQGKRLVENGWSGRCTLSASQKTPLTEGCQGNITRLVQEALKTLGFYDGILDGKFEGRTKEAVRKYNQQLGYGNNDHRFGNGCWKAILGM